MDKESRDPTTGKTADIDVFRVESKGACSCIECRGKRPGGEVTIDEVDAWLGRIPTFRSHLRNQERFREARQSFEFWTTGKFAADALARLKLEKAQRTRWPIDWKDGNAVSEIAKSAKEKAIRVALDNHFLNTHGRISHPVSMKRGTRRQRRVCQPAVAWRVAEAGARSEFAVVARASAPYLVL